MKIMGIFANITKFFKHFPLQYLGKSLVFSFIYTLSAILSLKFATINSSISPVWPPTGIAISILILFGHRFLFSIFLGATLANLYISDNFSSSVIIAFGNSLEAIVGFLIWSLLSHRLEKHNHFKSLISLPLASFFAASISASVGTLTLIVANTLQMGNFNSAWLTWWIGDSVGALVIVPFALYFKEISDFRVLFSNLRKQKIILILCCLYVVASYILLQSETSLKYIFTLFPLLVLASKFRSKLMLHFFAFLICALAIYATVSARGPFTHSNFNQNLLNLEIFLVAILVTSLCMSGIVETSYQKTTNKVFLAGWVLWGVIFYSITASHQITDDLRTEKLTQEVVASIRSQINIYENYLAGGKGLFQASTVVNSHEWRAYVNSLNLMSGKLGLNGMGVIKKTTANKYVVSMIEPLENNLPALGLDISLEERPREAAERSAETGQVILTKAIRLQQSDDGEYGFLLMMPVYSVAYPLTNREDRISNFSHWVYAPFAAKKFFTSVLRDFGDDYVLELYEQSPEKSVIYKNSEIAKSSTDPGIEVPLSIDGQDFILKFTRSVKYSSSSDLLSTWIGFIGAISLILVIQFLINIFITEEKANRLASEYIHEYKLAQEKIKLQESKLVDSARLVALGEMAGNIAHEINTPLAIINTTAQLIKKHVSQTSRAPGDPKIEEYTDKITSTVKKVSSIIQGLRKITRNATQDDFKLVGSKQLVEETVSFCNERMKNLEIEFTVLDKYQGEISCREVEISQVLVNLINNSIDAISSAKEKWIHIDLVQIGEFVQIRITDSGKGIPKEIQDKILLPFFTTKEVGKGTGIGLSISKGIVESHSGRFYLDNSHPNTSFVIELPIPAAKTLVA